MATKSMVDELLESGMPTGTTLISGADLGSCVGDDCLSDNADMLDCFGNIPESTKGQCLIEKAQGNPARVASAGQRTPAQAAMGLEMIKRPYLTAWKPKTSMIQTGTGWDGKKYVMAELPGMSQPRGISLEGIIKISIGTGVALGLGAIGVLAWLNYTDSGNKIKRVMTRKARRRRRIRY